MKREEAQKRIEKLKKVIKKHRYLYHVLDKQEISEEALDSLKKELFDLENRFPEFVTPDSPTQRVGGKPLDEFDKHRHFSPMLSFQDAFTEEDMTDWKKRMERHSGKSPKEFFCEYKIDGLALELVYEKSILKTASTRGDGLVGEDVTENVKTIEAIPLRLRSPRFFSDEEKSFSEDSGWLDEGKSLIVRGEIFISKKEFEKINKKRKKKGEKAYANPRNLAAGSIRQLDPKIVSSRNLDFFAYDLVADLNTEETINPFGAKTHAKKHKLVRSLGFKTTKEKVCNGLDEVFLFREEAEEEREKLNYEIDGIAVFVNDNQFFEDLGVTGKAPRGGIAYKFPLKKAVTEVKDIKVQVGRTGSVTPVAILKPVEVGGVTITRASLHNEDELKKKDVKIGDSVVVGRAGDVIPYVIRVLKEMRDGNEKDFIFPEKCPVCGSRLVKRDEEVVKRCPSDDCVAKKREQLKHFVSKSAFDIEGLGDRVIALLMEEGIVSDPEDIFEIKKGDLIPLEGFGEKSANNLISSIEKSKEISLSRFIYSLGIRQVGERTAVDLAREFKSLENIKNAEREELLRVKDIGPVAAEEIEDWFVSEKNLNTVNNLRKAGVRIKNEYSKKDHLSDKTFVFTGRMDSFSRRKAKEKVLSSGGNVANSITEKTDYLVVGENPGSKLEAARKRGIETINEEEFINLL